jgi:hypothetical protein
VVLIAGFAMPSPDFIVNTTSLGVSFMPFAPTVATLDDGRALVAWVSVTPDIYGSYHNADIRARWFNADGTPMGDDFVVNSTLADYQWRPSATASSDGTVMVTWDSGDGGDGDGNCVRGIILDPDVPEPGTDFILSSPREALLGLEGSDNQSGVSVTALSEGRFLALWGSQDGTDGEGYGIRGRLFDAEGTPLGDDVLLNSTGLGVQYDPEAVELSDGRILITYASAWDGVGESGSIRGRILNADGTPQAEDFVLNTTTEGYQIGVDVTALSEGRALAVWFTSGPIVPDEHGGNPNVGPGEVRAQVIGADGVPVGDDFAVNSTLLDFPYVTPAVTTLANGAVLVVWHSGDAGDGDWGCLRGRLLDANGTAVSQDFVINGTMMNNQSSPALQALPDGRVLITWSSDEGGGAGAQTRGVYLTAVLGEDGTQTLIGSDEQDVMMGLAGDDVMRGLDDADKLMGGQGQETMSGGQGDDLLAGQSGADSLVGGRGADVLVGGSGADTLNSGSGDDVMTGGAGRDSFVFGSGAGDVDRIADFDGDKDAIWLDDGAFDGLDRGALGAAFGANDEGQAESAEDRIIHDIGTGRIYYDADGSGEGDRVLFAVVDAGLVLTGDDFVVF